MRKILALTTVLALAAAPAVAGGNHGNGGNPCGGNCGNGNGGNHGSVEGISGGAFAGAAVSHSSGGSFAASGGLALGGSSGASFVRNEQSAGQLAGAFASYEGGTEGRLTSGTLVTETFTDGFSQSRTLTDSNGAGTVGAGAGWAGNQGRADAVGGFGGTIGNRNW